MSITPKSDTTPLSKRCWKLFWLNFWRGMGQGWGWTVIGVAAYVTWRHYHG
jgi:hypothetical protein